MRLRAALPRCLRRTVGDVEYGTHAVAVLGSEAAGGEADGSHHVGVDDAEAFLLAGADKLRTVYFYSVDVDAVLVVRTSTHGVLRRHFVAAAYTGHGGNKTFYRAAADVRRKTVAVGVDALQGVGLLTVVGDLDGVQGIARGLHLDVYSHVALGANELTP